MLGVSGALTDCGLCHIPPPPYFGSPLDSAGHLLDSVSVSFQYAAGYTGGANGGVVSLVMLDAFNHSLARTLWTSEQLSNYS